MSHPTFEMLIEAIKTLGYPIVMGLLFWFALRGDAKANAVRADSVLLKIAELDKKMSDVVQLESQHFSAMQQLIQGNADRNYRELRKQSNYLRTLVEVMGNKRHSIIIPDDDEEETDTPA